MSEAQVIPLPVRVALHEEEQVSAAHAGAWRARVAGWLRAMGTGISDAMFDAGLEHAVAVSARETAEAQLRDAEEEARAVRLTANAELIATARATVMAARTALKWTRFNENMATTALETLRARLVVIDASHRRGK